MPGRVLIVDDIASNRIALRAQLRAAYFEVVEADTGLAALALAAAEQPDLILLDVMMPGLDGLETCRRLKRDPATTHIPVVMLTALGRQSDRIDGLEAGADDFLSKPHSHQALFARVNSLIRMKMMIDELRLRHSTSHDLGLGGTTAFNAGLNLALSSIMLVSDDDGLIDPCTAAIRAALGCRLTLLRGESGVRGALLRDDFDAFVIGPRLADGEPLRVASMLRARHETRQSPVLMLFGAADLDRAILAMDLGIADYVTYPPDLPELVARLRGLVRRKYYSDQLRNAVRDTMALAVTDPLTGLYNRRYADLHLAAMVHRANDFGAPLAAMMLDLDRFKRINDGHGHATGDSVLREFARRLLENTRGVDLVARMGGEEFLVVMPDIQPDLAASVAERVRRAVENPGFQLATPGQSLDITVSIGLAVQEPGEGGASLIHRADAALYVSKSAGRNKVTLAAA